MRGFFTRLGNTIRYFMQGCYGMDKLGSFLLIVGLSLSFLSCIRPLSFFAIPSFVLIVWAYVRCFSKNFNKRQRELVKYLGIRKKISERYSLLKRIRSERKTHKFFKCRVCRAQLRVPRGKGKIEITCPKCRTKIIKKT